MTNTMVGWLVAAGLIILVVIGVTAFALAMRPRRTSTNTLSLDERVPLWSSSTTTITTTSVPAEPPQDLNPQEGMPMPTTEARYKTLDRVVSALEDAGLDEATVATVKEAYEAKNPSAFRDEASISDAEFRKRTVEFTRRHLRRFPRTQSALALSLRALAKGETTTYIK